MEKHKSRLRFWFLLGFVGGIGVGAIVSGWIVAALGYQGMFFVIACTPVVSLVIYAAGKKMGLGRPRTSE